MIGSKPPPYYERINIIWHCRKEVHEIGGIHTHLRWCEQLLKRKFHQCAPTNLETSCLLEIGDLSRESRLPVSLVCPCPDTWEYIVLHFHDFHTDNSTVSDFSKSNYVDNAQSSVTSDPWCIRPILRYCYFVRNSDGERGRWVVVT
jgi:hypothetical protein